MPGVLMVFSEDLYTEEPELEEREDGAEGPVRVDHGGGRVGCFSDCGPMRSSCYC